MKTLNRLAIPLLAGLIFLLGAPAPATGAPDFDTLRRQMIEEIEQQVRETAAQLDDDELDPRVIDAMAKVPREAFVPPTRRHQAYENRPLPIGYGQTISQPYIVAIMTDLLRLEPNDKVLEIGTGSGYQAAVASRLARKVYSIEIIEILGRKARKRLRQLGYDNIEVRLGDGYYGWKEHAPYDAIIVTAAASHIPPPLIRQLKPGGRMIIPVGSRFATQQLVLVEKRRDGEIHTRQLMPVTFVPLTGGHGRRADPLTRQARRDTTPAP